MLDDTRQEAVVLFVSDHGDMLGERGLWFKMNMFEASARVPLMIAGSGIGPGLVTTPVSTLDIGPTLAALAGTDVSAIADWTDGTDLLEVARSGRRAPVRIEYAAEASVAPLVALREGPWKLIRCAADPDLMFNLDEDPHELNDRASDPSAAEAHARLSDAIDARWNLSLFDAQVRESQARRLVVYDALRKGGYFPWDFQPLKQASERYMRNHMDLNVLEESQRFPRGE